VTPADSWCADWRVMLFLGVIHRGASHPPML
jgi:hypothetical protein